MIVINTSDILAEILPEVWYTLDPDLPHEHEIPPIIARYLKDLLYRAFLKSVRDDLFYNEEWLFRLRQDRLLKSLATFKWLDAKVIDHDGTIVLMIEEY